MYLLDIHSLFNKAAIYCTKNIYCIYQYKEAGEVVLSQNFIIHNSHDVKYREPFGAVSCGADVTLRVEANTRLTINSAKLVLIEDNGAERHIDMQLEQQQDEKHLYVTRQTVLQEPGLLWYYFKLNIDGVDYFYGNNSNAYGGIGHIAHHIPVYYQITVFEKAAKVPSWYKDAVIYQIFVDRFFNGNEDGKILNLRNNSFLYSSWEDTPCYIKDRDTGEILKWDFFGGNLLGVIKKLDYLKDLGINTIYLNPVFDSPSSHKYDTSDYKSIDKMFGDNEIFRRLCEEAKAKGMSIILDGVFSHTGSDSIYFNRYGSYNTLGAYQSKESPYYSWYRFHDHPHSYECWWGIDNMPNINEMNPDYRRYIISDEDSVIKYWIKQGIKGWRLDVADELPDEFIKELKAAMQQQDPESILIGEVWEDASNKISYGSRRRYLLGEELDSVMNYPFRSIMMDYILSWKSAEQANAAMMSLKENYPPHNFYANMNLIGTHDVPRILTILGEAPAEEALSYKQKSEYKLDDEKRRLAISRLKLMSLIQMTFPGVPSIYYGDEAGVEGHRDPLNRKTYPWGKEDTELLEWYKKLIAARHKYSCLSTGDFIPLYARDTVYAYLRIINNEKDAFGEYRKNSTAVVILNRSKHDNEKIEINLKPWLDSGCLIDILSNNEYLLKEGILNIELKPLEGKIFICKGSTHNE